MRLLRAVRDQGPPIAVFIGTILAWVLVLAWVPSGRGVWSRRKNCRWPWNWRISCSTQGDRAAWLDQSTTSAPRSSSTDAGISCTARAQAKNKAASSAYWTSSK